MQRKTLLCRSQKAVPFRFVPEARGEEVDERPRLGGEIPVRRVERVDAERRLGKAGEHGLEAAGFDVGPDQEGRQFGDAEPGQSRRAQHVAVVGAETELMGAAIASPSTTIRQRCKEVVWP